MNATRMKAYTRFNAALSKGEIKRPKVCENCGATDDKARIMGHHEDYSQPLVVTWLCGSCHQNLHYMKDPGRGDRVSKSLFKIYESRKPNSILLLLLDDTRREKGHTVKEVCEILGIAQITYYKWKKNGCSPREGTRAAIERYIESVK